MCSAPIAFVSTMMWRTVGDNVQSVFNYSDGRRLIFSSITDNAKNGNELWIYGTEGSVQITIEDATFFYEKKLSNQPTTDKPVSKTIVERGVVTGASYSTAGEMPNRGVGERVQALGPIPHLSPCGHLWGRCGASMESKPMCTSVSIPGWPALWRMTLYSKSSD